MATTDPQRRQILPSRRCTLPVAAEDGPWIVTVAENPHDPSSYTIYVRTHARNLTLNRSAREITELHRQLRDAYPAVPRPAFPIRFSAGAQPAKQFSTIQPTFPRLASPADQSEGARNNARRSVTVDYSAHTRVPSDSENTMNMALTWYLTALSNDPVFRQVPPWKNFVRIRTEDLESASVNAITTAMEKSNSLDSTIVRGPRACSSAEGDFSVNTYERSTSQKPMNSATLTKESDLYRVQVSDFEMVCVLGIGSRAKVLLAQHKGSSRSYALKVIAKRRVLASQEVQRTLTEQSVLRRMAIDGANPFVAKLWRSFHDEDNLYLAMDFYLGGDLRTQLDRCGTFFPDRSRFYAAEIVEGIEGLHAAGVIHRNLKPEHILIDKGGHIVICGFGKSKEFRRGTARRAPSGNPSAGCAPHWMNGSEELSSSFQSDYADKASSLCGTAAYFAPEVIMGLPYSYEIDWWSVGTILYEMLTGIRPFDADNPSDMYDRILQDDLQFPENEHVDRHTKDFIQGLLQRDPASRLSGPQIKRHPYFLMIDWSDVHYRGCKPPYIPPTDSSNLSDTQNFEEAFLNMKPVIGDEIYKDMEPQKEERDQADLGRASGEDSIASPSRPRISPVYPPDNGVDVFEGYSFNDRQSGIVEEGAPGKGEEAEEDGETEAEAAFGRNDLTEQTILLAEALQALIPPIQQRPAEPPPPVSTDATSNLVPFPNATLFAIPDIPAQAPAPPPTLPTGVVANAATATFARHHNQTSEPKSLHKQSNYKRTRQEKTVAEPDRFSDDHNDGGSDTSHGERFDNFPWKFLNVDRGNHNGPGLIKAVSKRSFSTVQSLSSLRTAGSKNTSTLR